MEVVHQGERIGCTSTVSYHGTDLECASYDIATSTTADHNDHYIDTLMHVICEYGMRPRGSQLFPANFLRSINVLMKSIPDFGSCEIGLKEDTDDHDH